MRIELKVPQLSESVSEATLLNWKKQAGAAVQRDENLIDIETDKVMLESPSPSDGILVEIVKPSGSNVTSGDIIAIIDTDGKATAANDTPTTPSPSSPKTPTAPTAAPTALSNPASTARGIGPAARKLMAEGQLTTEHIAGSGPGGRITKADVLQVQKPISTQTIPTPLPSTPAMDEILTDRPQQRVPMTRLRARIAERLLQSSQENAILTTFNEVNMAPVIDLRKKYGEKFEKENGVRLGFMGFFVKAVVQALRRYPVLNASVDGNDIIYHGFFDIGIAVGSPRGLVVPILRDADQLTMAAIEKKIAEFGTKAKDGKLTIEELTGGTFSISNGGIFGSMLSTPIINPPQSAILGIHATKDRPVVENGQIVIRPMNYLALSYDHRIIDGREAVLGLVAIKEALEDPARLVLDI